MEEGNKDLALKLKAIIETAIDGIITITDRGIVETMNIAASNLFGYQPEEIIGKNISVLMPEPDKKNHDKYIENYNRTKKPKIIGIGREVFGLKKDGSIFPFRLAVSEVILNDRVIFTGIIHDLTEMHKAQDEILNLNKKLEQKVVERTYDLENVVNKLLKTNKKLKEEVSERIQITEKLAENEEELKESLEKEKELNELKSRFVSMASHEFRTPLASILSSAAIIGRYEEKKQQVNREKHVNRIKSAVSNLTGILNDFLSLSKLEEGKELINLSEVKIDSLCKTVIEETSALLKADQEIKHEIIGSNRTIHTDERILKNILFNLISNAIKYSDKSILCKFEIVDNDFIFEVKDSGIGIPYDDQKYMFTRFFRAGNVTNIQGTGLGLTIVKRYVDLLGGEIRFESEPEKGTSFFVTIPIKRYNEESINN